MSGSRIAHLADGIPKYKALLEPLKNKTLVQIAHAIDEYAVANNDNMVYQMLFYIFVEHKSHNISDVNFDFDNFDRNNCRVRYGVDIINHPDFTYKPIKVNRMDLTDIQEVLSDETIYRLTGEEESFIVDPVDSYVVYEFGVVPYQTYHKFEYTKTYLLQIYEYLRLGELNIVIAGGVFSCLMGIHPADNASDIDLFIIANSREEAISTVKRFYEMHSTSINGYEVQVYMSENCITFITHQHTIQLILRWYEKPEQVIEKFDLAPCMIFMYNREIYCNAEAKFWYQHNCMILNPAKRRNTFSPRLKKYMKRNMGVLMYDCVLPTEGSFTINKLSFRIIESSGNYINCALSYKSEDSGESDWSDVSDEYNNSEESNEPKFYESSDTYESLDIVVNNAIAGKLDINSSNIIGRVMYIDGLLFVPETDVSVIYEHIDDSYDQLILKFMRMLGSKKLIDMEIIPQLLLHIYQENYDEFSNQLCDVIRGYLSNLKQSYAATLKRYDDEFYEKKCPLNPCPISLYGEYYSCKSAFKMVD